MCMWFIVLLFSFGGTEWFNIMWFAGFERVYRKIDGMFTHKVKEKKRELLLFGL